MRRAIVLLARCYPRDWRMRYGVEFDALMEDVTPDFREFTNVLGGAVKLQLRSGTGLFKIAGAMAVVGMLVSVGAWKISPQRYKSTVQLRVTVPSGGDAARVDQDLRAIMQQVLSRSSLAELIQRPSLDLYHRERQRLPMEDVIQQMRRDIQIVRILPREGRPGGTALSISYAYPDRLKAPAVVRELTRKFVEGNVAVARNRESLWQSAWKEHAPPAGKVEPVSPPTYPSDPETRLTPFLAWGLGVGLALGLLVFAVVRRPRVMRQLAVCGLAGCALAAAASFLIPEKFTSNAVMSITPPVDPKRWYAGTTPEPAADRVYRLKRTVMDTMKTNAEETIGIEVWPTAPTAASFHIYATAGSAIRAQSLVREAVSGFFRQFVAEAQAQAPQGEEIRFMEEQKMGPNLEVLDPASLPQTPVSPNRAVMAGFGLLAGLLAGAALAWRRRPRGPEMTSAVAQPI